MHEREFDRRMLRRLAPVDPEPPEQQTVQQPLRLAQLFGFLRDAGYRIADADPFAQGACMACGVPPKGEHARDCWWDITREVTAEVKALG